MNLKSLLEKKSVIAFLIIIFMISLILLGWLGTHFLKPQPSIIPTTLASVTFPPSPTSMDRIASIQITPPPTPTITQEINANSSLPALTAVTPTGAFILSLMDGGFYHLFLYNPQTMPFIRLTDGKWDDVSPAVNPDGTRVVYSSNQTGHWDLYNLDLASGVSIQLTNTSEYDGNPCWSPDGQWIVFDTYQVNHLTIDILDLNNLSNPPLPLTNDPSVNSRPVWSPRGRKIAFTSIQMDSSRIWIADLDQPNKLLSDAGLGSSNTQQNPAWSPDGKYLSWSATEDGNAFIYVADLDNPQTHIQLIGEGSSSVWDANGHILYTLVQRPNQIDLEGYNLDTNMLSLPLIHLPVSAKGVTWLNNIVSDWIDGLIASGKQNPPESNSHQNINTQIAGQLIQVSPLEGIKAPYPFLVPSAIDSFFALKSEIGANIGWDFLLNLDNAYLPLTLPSDPDQSDKWLYTGRAIAVNSLPLQAGWMAISREDFSGQVFWRLYLKTYKQDGSQGSPIENLVWDLASRSSGDPAAYDNGGKYSLPPIGYWVDITALMQSEGWQRLPALNEWRSFYPALRFTQFIYPEGLDWTTALNQLYPPEALLTYTPIPTSSHIVISTPTH